MQFMTVDEMNESELADHQPGEEISPGVILERRTILRFGVSFAALAAMGGAWALPGCANARPTGASRSKPLSLDELVTLARAEAGKVVASDAPDEERYVAAIGSLLARCGPPPDPRFGWRYNANDWAMDTMCYFPPIVLFQMRLKPGAVIELHDHRHYNGVLLLSEGSARVRNFDIVQPDGVVLDIAGGEVPPSGEEFLIRSTNAQALRPGDLSTLTRDRDNIHHVVAGDEGCTLVDFFTHFRAQARSYELVWDDKPISPRSDLYKVSWKDG